MCRNLPPLLLTALLVAACGSVPPDPNMTRADRALESRAIGGCQPSTGNPPRLLSGRSPIYPVGRLMAQKDGYAILEFDITPDGRAENFKKIESSHPKFYSHTRVAVEDWKFSPAELDGTPILVRCQFRQDFIVPHKSHRNR